MRVVNSAEPALGLGTVVGVQGRRLEVLFPAAEERRTYNRDDAPLRRLVLKVGQEARGAGGVRFHVERVEEREGRLVYHGGGRTLPEVELDSCPNEAGALDHLLEGHLGQPGDFELRADAWNLRSGALGDAVRGLVGARVELLPHQLYIARKVSRMERPRVLLADEVGLGKTIESGLIFCALRSLGRAGRVLVLVPEPLIHQWLAEMYRRFNEMLTVVGPEQLPTLQRPVFEWARRALCPVDFLVHQPELLEEGCQAGWDLLVVDEAHHLRWNPHQASPGYRAVERLSRASEALLLLTATPLRGGLETEFGLLRMVDPERFHDFEAFQREHGQLVEVAALSRDLCRGPAAPAAEALARRFPDLQAEAELARSGPVEPLLGALVDRHGTGRVLIRNRRECLAGLFPGRELIPLALPTPDLPWTWREDPVGALFAPPEPGDPRLEWLEELVAGTTEKIMVICRRAPTAAALQQELRRRLPVRTALFHEQMGLLERDRQAAFFAEPEGARVLLCSEVAGEGRNFQFAHRLVLFDLPLHADRIEQRLGRLDRIGQRHRVSVYVPYLRSSPWEVLFRWHHEGLRSFEGPVPGAQALLADFKDRLLRLVEAFARPGAADRARLTRLVRTARERAQALRLDAAARIDPLVDRNSYDPQVGEELAEGIRQVDGHPALQEVLGRLLERLGLSDEPLDDAGLRRIRAGEMMFVESVPGLPPEGVLACTYRRDRALSREDLAFLTRDHPLVQGSVSLLLDQPDGRAASCLLPGAAASNIAFQFLFLLQAQGPPHLELERYLPPTVAQTVVDFRGTPRPELREVLLAQACRLLRLSPEVHSELMARLGSSLPRVVQVAAQEASRSLDPLRTAALARAETLLRGEQTRLEELARVNLNLGPTQLRRHRDRLERTLECLGSAAPQLDAVRLVVLRR